MFYLPNWNWTSQLPVTWFDRPVKVKLLLQISMACRFVCPDEDTMETHFLTEKEAQQSCEGSKAVEAERHAESFFFKQRDRQNHSLTESDVVATNVQNISGASMHILISNNCQITLHFQ